MFIKRLASLSAVAFVVGLFTGCSSDVERPYPPPFNPEARCIEWSAASCAKVSTCCQAGSNFDQFECEAGLSSYCLDNLKLELAHTYAFVIDEALVDVCLTPIAGCDMVEPKKAHPLECANMVSGHRPLGVGCSSVLDCARPAEGRAVCYEGNSSGYRVCAQILTSTSGKCSFSKETLKYVTCPEETYCDQDAVVGSPPEIPSDLLEFEADCKPYRAAGETCFVKNGNDWDPLPCKSGLYCQTDMNMIENSKCQPYKKVGDMCDGSAGQECGPDAFCDFNTSKCVADEPDDGEFCYAPPKCGDSKCQAGETITSCVEDCGYCGDGTCTMTESQEGCSPDCGYCGNGICEQNEATTCPLDCTQMGCTKCGDYVANSQMGTLCSASEPLFIALGQCMCNGACATACAGSFCMNAQPNGMCAQCAQNMSTGCGNVFTACVNDM